MGKVENQLILKDNEYTLKFHSIKKMIMILKSFHHPIRQQIIKIIDTKKEINVTDIYISLKLGQSITSQHLANLRKSGIILTHREGKNIFYSLNYNFIKKIIDVVSNISSY